MKAKVYDWDEFNSDGLLQVRADKEALELIVEYYDAKIEEAVKDKNVEELTEGYDELGELIRERRALVKKLKEGQENEKSVAE